MYAIRSYYEQALAHDAMDASRVAEVREEMERAEARRLQPHYIEAFFIEAFRQLGGALREREPRRYEVQRVPAPVRRRDREVGVGEARPLRAPGRREIGHGALGERALSKVIPPESEFPYTIRLRITSYNVCYTKLLRDMKLTGAIHEDLEGIVNYPRNIQGVEVGMLFKVIHEGAVKVSLRSAGKVDVAKVAQHFGGGGHVRAAGARIEGDLAQIVSRVVEQVKLQL